ncbi:nucleoside/nucleotide kinase family protein [Butyrivibrio fibrisolvens]|uniref:nucleoside/nucleotide kinase family protein n=1 Tax=Butyrivibrio fibrisolvens TaxID=831 RepID=UPI0030CC8E9E
MDLLKYTANINGIETSVEYSENNVNEIFIPLLKQMKELKDSKGSRILVMLAAPPGAGKSTLLSFLKYLSENTEGLEPISVVGMDGFHRYQEYLLTHTMVRDGKEIPMVDVKGAPETFDIDKLLDKVKSVARGDKCGWPDYNRMTHNPQEDAIIVDSDIVILEGNYLLLKDKGWDELKGYADLTISIAADEDLLRKRLIDRKIKSGKSEAQATEFVEFSDMYNVRTVLNKSSDADIRLMVLEDCSYIW